MSVAVQQQEREPIRVSIGAQIRIPMDGLGWEVLSKLKVPLTRDNPAFATARRGGHDVKPKILGWAKEDGWGGPELVLPRGQAGLVVRILREAGLELEIERDVCEGEALECAFSGTLRPYQQPAVDAAVRGVQGLIVAPCGSGKTMMGMAAAARVGRTTLILVHTHDLATQLADEGLDLPRLTGVILAMPSRAKGRTEQRLGRVMRPAPGKPTPRLYDVQDESVGIFRSQARRRMQAFRKVLGEIKPRVLDLRQREMR